MSWSGAPSHRQSPPFRSLIFYSLERTEFFAISSWKIAGNNSRLRQINTSNGNLLSVDAKHD
jgi:hypothetical protein